MGTSAMRNRLLIVCVLILSVASVAFATDFAIVVNPANPLRELTLVELGKIFRAKTTIWPDGKGITLVLRDPNSPGNEIRHGQSVRRDIRRREGRAELIRAARPRCRWFSPRAMTK